MDVWLCGWLDGVLYTCGTCLEKGNEGVGGSVEEWIDCAANIFILHLPL